MNLNIIVSNSWYVLIAFVIFDVLTGILASVKEKKINSTISYKGLIKKISLFLMLAFVEFLDVFFAANSIIKNAGISLIVLTEGMSIIENFNRVGIDLSFLTKYFDEKKLRK